MIQTAPFVNIGTLNVHELFCMLQCTFNTSVRNFTKSDESTFFVLNVD